MPLPIDPAIPIDTSNDILPLSGSLLQPWFDSGEIKAIIGTLGRYTTEIVDPKIDAAAASGGGLFDYIDFNTTAGLAADTGGLTWNDTYGTLDIGLKGGNVVLHLGQKQVTQVVNKTGADLLAANYQCVKIDGAQGQRLKITLAQANNDANSADTIGLINEDIANNQEGFVCTSGIVTNLNTTGSIQGETWNDGDILYLSGTIAGRLTNVKPAAPTHTVIVGFVIYAHNNQGKIYVKVDNGYELDELHNVLITTPVNNQVLQYDSATNLWKNQTLAAGGAGGTVTSVGLTMPGIFTVTNSPVTTTGTLTASLASQTANTVFIAPNGSAGAPTFRALVAADIPTLAQSKITNLTTDLAAKAALASPTFTGTPSLPTGTIGVTQAVDNNTTALATTAYVVGQGYSKLASPTFTGTPAAPTASVGTNTTQLATTAFVNAEIANDAVLLSTNQTVAGNKTFSGTTALASTSTIDGAIIGYRDVPVTISNAAKTFALSDAGKAFGKDNGTAYTYTIPANGTVAFPVGTVITVFNNNATSNITVDITTDTLRLAGTTTTGSRIIAPFSLCTLFKVSSTVWLASGAGVS